MASGVRFPLDWLDPKAGAVATDLDLAVLLVNSYDALVDPPDRLHDLRWLTTVLSEVGRGSLADELEPADLESLRELRAGLRAAFEAADVETAARVLNPMLAGAGAVPLLVTSPDDGGRASLEAGVGTRGAATLRVRLPLAVAQHIAGFGVARLGTCGSDPCHCAFVDRTRAGTKRYCCVWCNDRASARAYRRRRRD